MYDGLVGTSEAPGRVPKAARLVPTNLKQAVAKSRCGDDSPTFRRDSSETFSGARLLLVSPFDYEVKRVGDEDPSVFPISTRKLFLITRWNW